MLMTNKVLGDIPQYVIKNILLVHNRHNPNKRNYVKNESGDNFKQQRLSNNWYKHASEMSYENCWNIWNPNHKPFAWKDVWQKINKGK
jgi:hypothetical protein